MPNIRSQQIDSQGIAIVASDGRTFSVTKEEILTYFKAQTGSASTRKSKTLTWLKNSIISALGTEQIDINNLTLDIRTSDGTPTELVIAERGDI